MATLRINRLHWPVTTLGFGRRVGIWVQGCGIGCPGCCSRDTWDPDAGAALAIDDLLAWIGRHPLDTVDGFTISGGEPVDQHQALAELADALRGIDGRERDLLVYSGYPWRILQHHHADLIARFDAVVSEPYVRTLPGAPLMGSSNQTLHRLTPLARTRYPETSEGERAGSGKRLQAAWDGEHLWMIGIPAHGDLQALQKRLAERGLAIRDASWLA
jgi:anaerobic ribonucleoside-triphosphate reductase activating protein